MQTIDAIMLPLKLEKSLCSSRNEFFSQRSGERLRKPSVIFVRSISEPKTTRVGHGRFWVIEVTITNQRGEWVGTDSYDCFGYRRTQP